MTEDLPGIGQAGDKLDPALVSPAVVYMASSLSGDQTGKFLYSGGGRVAEMKVMTAKGANLGPKITAELIAERAADVFFPEDKK